MSPDSPSISAVITCLNEESTIEAFVAALAESLERTGLRHEIVLVDDGSTDGTFAAITRLVATHPAVPAGLELMRNAGQAAAITAGLAEARGSHVLMMDSDFQLEPSDIGVLVTEALAGADVVNGYRLHRRDPLGRRLPSLLANWIMRRVSGKPLRDFGCTFRLVDRRLIDAFRLGPDHVLSIPLLFSRAGRVREVPVRHSRRPQGKSGWTFGKLWRYNADNLIVLAEPVFQWTGLGSLLVAALLVVRVALDPWLHWSLIGSVTTGLLLNAVAAGTLVLTGLLCIVGEFVVRAHRASLARPAFVVRRRVAKAA